MSVQRLSSNSIRRIARVIDLPTITRSWSYGGYVMEFATWDHEHGWYDKKTGEWDIDKDARHLTSCYDAEDVLLVNLEPFDDDGHWPTLNS